MKENVLPIAEDQTDAPGGPAAAKDARALQTELNSAFDSTRAASPQTESQPQQPQDNVTANRRPGIIADLNGRIERLEDHEEIESLRAAVRDVCAAVAFMASRANQAQAEMSAGIASLRETLDARTSAIARVLEGLKESGAREQQERTELAAQLQSLQGEAAANRDSIGSLQQRIDDTGLVLSQDMAAVTQQLTPLQRDIQHMAERLSQVENDGEQFNGLGEKSALQDARLDKAEQSISAITRRNEVLSALHAETARTLRSDPAMPDD